MPAKHTPVLKKIKDLKKIKQRSDNILNVYESVLGAFTAILSYPRAACTVVPITYS